MEINDEINNVHCDTHCGIRYEKWKLGLKGSLEAAERRSSDAERIGAAGGGGGAAGNGNPLLQGRDRTLPCALGR